MFPTLGKHKTKRPRLSPDSKQLIKQFIHEESTLLFFLNSDIHND